MTTDKNLLIKVEGLEKSFGKIEVLKGIDTEINKGDVVVVIGPSGSGKSTFLRTLNLLERPTGGKILFEGTDITDPTVDINVHRQKMGMVFQQFNLFPHMTILKNMTLAPMKLLKKARKRPKPRRLSFFAGSVLRTERGHIPPSFRAAKSRGWQLSAPLPWTPTSCFSTSRRPLSTPKWWARCLRL